MLYAEKNNEMFAFGEHKIAEIVGEGYTIKHSDGTTLTDDEIAEVIKYAKDNPKGNYGGTLPKEEFLKRFGGAN